MSLQDAKLILTSNGYKAGKVYAVKPTDGTGDATVVRNVTKTRVNSSRLIESNSANVLAPDYLNGVCPALNVEGQATNLVKYSEQFDNTYWIKANVNLLTDFAVSPDSTQNAEKIVADNTNNVHSVLSETVGGAGIYNFSAFAKADGYDFLEIGTNNPSSSVFFNIKAGTVIGTTGAAPTNIEIKLINNGWYRCSFTQTLTGVSRLNLFLSDDGINRTFVGDGVSGILLWGAQLEEGTELSSYIPTTTAQVTRSADTVTVPIPAGTTEIIEKYEDGTTNTITTIPASPYTVPTGKRYEYILMR